MTQQGVSVFTLPIKNNLNDQSDRFVFLFGADTANTPTSVAQTATITAINLFQNSGLIIAANTVSANSFVANVVTANSYDVFFGQPLLTQSFTLSAAQIANCYANVVTILPAQGANTLIYPIQVYAYSSIGNPWVSNGTTGFWLGQSAVDDGVLSATLTTSNYFGATATFFFGKLGMGGLINTPLNFTANGGAPTGGNTGITGVLQYVVLENMPL